MTGQLKRMEPGQDDDFGIITLVVTPDQEMCTESRGSFQVKASLQNGLLLLLHLWIAC